MCFIFPHRFGPLVRFGTMRFEAKHSHFKSLSYLMGNFTNLPYSLAMRHQQLQCYEKSTGFKASHLTVGPGKLMVFFVSYNQSVL